MWRWFISPLVTLMLAAAGAADGKVPVAFPNSLPVKPAQLTKYLPYVQAIHQVLDAVTAQDAPAVVQVKKAASASPSEWIVHRVQANVWVERRSANYLGEIIARVEVPCAIDYSLDLNALTPQMIQFDRERRLLVVELPAVRVREPVPALADLKLTGQCKGLRNAWLDGEALRALQAAALQDDYQPAAREIGLTEVLGAQLRARHLMQEFLDGIFRAAGADVRVIVR